MQLSDLFRETCTALTANKVRSCLTTLGIVIGIGSVISMISIGQGAEGAIRTNIEGLGSNLLTVMPGFVQSGRGFVSAGRGSAQTLSNGDAQILQAINGVSAVSPEFNRRFQITAPTGNNSNATVVGVTPAYAAVRNVSVAHGSFLTENHVRSLGRVTALGPTLARDLFGDADPVGQTIRVNRVNFKVIGVLSAKGSAGFFNPDDTAFVPLPAMQKILAGVDYLSTIAVSVEHKDRMPEVQELATAALAAAHRVDPQNPDFSVISQSDILGALTQVTNTFTAFLASIAGISLVVGGIGIMNMMFTTVTERTREIGLRKAIGAKRSDISAQFLAESVMLTVVGGALGVAVGWVAAVLISRLAGIATQVAPGAVLLAFGVSAGIGIVFGYYPARRASYLNPIDALRYE